MMIPVFNPADGSLVGQAPQHDTAQVLAAIDRTVDAFAAWAARLATERCDILRRWLDLVRADKQLFAELITKENGKCLTEALGEVAYGLGFIEWYAEEGKRIYGDTIPSHTIDGAIVVTREPVGPVAAITPWNFPFMMITRKVATALAAGCTIVIKPSEETPLSAYKLLEYARRAGIPAGVFEMVTGDPVVIGSLMTGDARLRKLTFTGSTAIGKLLARDCAANLKRVTMELGGNAPFIVFDDANLDAAADGLVAAKLRNSGQVCISPNRVYVQAGIYDAFAAKVIERVAALEVGQGLRPESVVGPLINQKAVGKVDALVRQAHMAGADLALGGKAHALGGMFYEPTVLLNVTDAMDVATTEIFGPVFPIYRFESEAEVVRRANDTEYGLVAYVYTRALGRSMRMSRAIESGMVIINSGSVGTASVPFGGVKQSGYGREGGYLGIEDYVEAKYVLFAGLMDGAD